MSDTKTQILYDSTYLRYPNSENRMVVAMEEWAVQGTVSVLQGKNSGGWLHKSVNIVNNTELQLFKNS